MIARTPFWTRMARRFLPGRVWSGAGIIVRKAHREATAATALVFPVKVPAVTEGPVAERWILVVLDESGEEHYVNVAYRTWEEHEIGDVITAEDPLVNTP